MENIKIRYLIVILLMVATAFASNSQQYNSSQDDDSSLSNLMAIPMQIGKWKGQDILLDETVYTILETRAIINRSYTDKNYCNVLLTIVHYHDTKVDFHAPEACLGGRGLNTQKKTKKITLFSGAQQKAIDIAQITTKNQDNQTLTYYFYKSGNYIGSNYIKMRLSIAANKITKNDTKGSLIRMSTALAPGKKEEKESQLIDFMEEALPYIQESL